jgi:hypothetical protein
MNLYSYICYRQNVVSHFTDMKGSETFWLIWHVIHEPLTTLSSEDTKIVFCVDYKVWKLGNAESKHIFVAFIWILLCAHS